jgi:flagellar protein FliJ
MKKFQFPLDKLLTYKNQILENELQLLAELNLEHQMALEKMSVIQKNYEKCKAKLDNKLSAQSTPAECQLYMYYIVDLNEQTKQVQLEIERISMRIVEQVNQVKQLKMETKAVENLKETRMEDFRKAEAKRIEAEMDEFVAASKFYQ